jgi:exodeoxyribonuclease-3
MHLAPRERQRIVICGDFNICHHDIDIHHPQEASKRQLSGFLPNERAWMDRLENLGFVDCFRHLHPTQEKQYTWWTYRAQARNKNLGWRIDYFFCSEKLVSKLRSATIHSDIGGSDHCPISIELE